MADNIIVKGINRCWNLRGSNREICSIKFQAPNQSVLKNGLISISNDKNSPKIKTPFAIEQCDPEKEICDIPFYLLDK